jgi:hypothetical protein
MARLMKGNALNRAKIGDVQATGEQHERRSYASASTPLSGDTMFSWST